MIESPTGSDAARVPPASLEAHLHVPLGAVSPLWFFYASAAAAGATAWWMTRWMQPVNLEALWGEATLSSPLRRPLPPPGAGQPTAPESPPEPLAAEPPTAAAGAVAAAATA
ncbi:MAG: hypothetical protein ACK4TR_09830, partial [Phenylobacterium sp.]